MRVRAQGPHFIGQVHHTPASDDLNASISAASAAAVAAVFPRFSCFHIWHMMSLLSDAAALAADIERKSKNKNEKETEMGKYKRKLIRNRTIENIKETTPGNQKGYYKGGSYQKTKE